MHKCVCVRACVDACGGVSVVCWGKKGKRAGETRSESNGEICSESERGRERGGERARKRGERHVARGRERGGGKYVARAKEVCKSV